MEANVHDSGFKLENSLFENFFRTPPNFTQKDDNGNIFLNSPIKSISPSANNNRKSNKEHIPAPNLGQQNTNIFNKE
jgi:hypothetical protein